MATATKPLPAPHKKRRDPIWELFSSVKLTIPLVLLWAVASIVGTVVKQFPTPQDLEALYTPAQVAWMQRLDLFDAYHSWWYRLILTLLATNLIVCSIERIPGVLRVIRNPRERLNEIAWTRMPMSRTMRVEGASVPETAEKLSAAVRKEFGRPRAFEVGGERQLFAEAGSWSRAAPYLVHVSLLVIFAGGFLGSAFGYRGSLNIFEGETGDKVQLFQSEGSVTLPFAMRCDDFDVKFYPDGTPRDFKSEVTILSPDGAELTRTDLRVNHPFKWESIRFYQASYGQSAKIVLDVWPGVPEEAAKAAPPLDKSALGDHAPIVRRTREDAEPPKRLEAPIGWPADKPLRHVVFNAWDQVRFPFEGTTLQILETQGDFGGFGPAVKVGLERTNGDREMFWLFQRYPGFDAALRRGPETFVLRGVEPWFYTGIQVTKDPGVEVVYAGCLMLMAGLVFAFFQSHRRLWARVREKEGAVEVTVAADVNKNKLGFEREFDRLAAEFAARLGATPARGAPTEGDK